MAKRPIPQNRIKELREVRGWTMAELGERIGKDASYVNKLEKRAQSITSEMLLKLALAFETDTGNILSDSAAKSKQPEILDRAPRAETDPVNPRIPVFGMAAGSHLQGAIQLLTGPVDYVETPKALANARDLYAVYVVGESMEPMFRHGAICLVSPHKPPKIGDAVIIEEQKGAHAACEVTIGVLEGVSGGSVAIRKLKPSAVIQINSRYILRMHKVLDMGDVLGVAG